MGRTWQASTGDSADPGCVEFRQRRSGMGPRSYYAAHGIGGRVGFGRRPTILVIDMQNDFLDPTGHLDMGPEARGVIPQIARVLEAGRRAGLPIVYTAQTHRPDFA